MASLTMTALKKAHGDFKVLHGIDMTISDGELLVLVGPSGCGKSTLLRCIAGLEDITAGELRIGDKRVNDLAPRDRDVAMVFQSYALYPHMTVRQNMGFALKIRRLPPAEISAAVDAAAQMLGLEALMDRRPAEMSGGQRQRVAMGRAIVRRPSVFLFDEPLSNLDAALRSQLRVELKQLHARLGTTMVYVTHDQTEAMTLADRIAVLKDGRLMQLGTPAELYEDPDNRFVAGFIGSPSMSFLEKVSPGVVLGVRPHQVALLPADAQADPTGEDTHDVIIEVVETLGFESFIYLRLGDEPLTARVEGRPPAPGPARARLLRVLRFHPDTGERLR